MTQNLAGIPATKRRGSFIMGLLWLTMVTGFPCVISGFTWAKTNYPVSDITISLLLSYFILVIYAFLASYLGSSTGQTYTIMTRSIFGLWGSYIISIIVIGIASLWYAMTALFLSTALIDLFALPLNAGILAAILAILMAFNNLFGFKGITVFAGYIAAPALIIWILLVLTKLLPDFTQIINQVKLTNLSFNSFAGISSFVLGFGAWGNEADFWRYSKPHKFKILIALILTIFVGQVIFPLTGYVIGKLNSHSAIVELPKIMTHYTYCGNSTITALVLIASYFAVNDSCLYGLANAVKNIHPVSRKKIVIIVSLITAILAYYLNLYPNAFLWIANLSASILPQASILLIVEWFLFTKNDHTKFSLSITDNTKIKWLGCLALLCGYLAGFINSRLSIQNTNDFNSSNVVFIWLVSLIVYCILKLIFKEAKQLIK